MFTGLITHLAKTKAFTRSQNGDAKLVLELPQNSKEEFFKGIVLGDSISVNGCCLTVTDFDANLGLLAFSLSKTTLDCTIFGLLGQTFSDIKDNIIRIDAKSPVTGQWFNLEKSLTPSTPMGGHYVSGHVDAVITLTQVDVACDGYYINMMFEAPQWMDFVADKGSVCINGVSLTVTKTTREGFGVTLIPHTLEMTTLKDLKVMDKVNFEIDMLARYMVNYLRRQTNGL